MPYQEVRILLCSQHAAHWPVLHNCKLWQDSCLLQTHDHAGDDQCLHADDCSAEVLQMQVS